MRQSVLCLRGGIVLHLSSLRCALAVALLALMCAVCGAAQSLPTTEGETLSGKNIILSQAMQGHTTILVAGFSREGGNRTGAWMKAIQADPALTHVSVYQVAMLAGAPALLRGMIRSGMKKGVAPADQDRFVVLTRDEQPWRSYFQVSTDQDPYVMLIGVNGAVLWRGHGDPAALEPQLRAALH
jgi:hypothetical protein